MTEFMDALWTGIKIWLMFVGLMTVAFFAICLAVIFMDDEK